MNWREIKLLARYSRPGDAFYQVFGEQDAQWPRTDQLLAAVVDGLNELAWMYQCAHSEQPPPRPSRVERPGVSVHQAEAGTSHYGFDPIPAADFNDWWNGGGG